MPRPHVGIDFGTSKSILALSTKQYTPRNDSYPDILTISREEQVDFDNAVTPTDRQRKIMWTAASIGWFSRFNTRIGENEWGYEIHLPETIDQLDSYARDKNTFFTEGFKLLIHRDWGDSERTRINQLFSSQANWKSADVFRPADVAGFLFNRFIATLVTWDDHKKNKDEERRIVATIPAAPIGRKVPLQAYYQRVRAMHYALRLGSADRSSAGVRQIALIEEPAAAAAYVWEKLNPNPPAGQQVLVVDYGAGTLDIALIERADRGFRVLFVDGEELGGNLVDQAISQKALNETNERWKSHYHVDWEQRTFYNGEQPLPAGDFTALRMAAKRAKEKWSRQQVGQTRMFDGEPERVPNTNIRIDFDDLTWQSIINRCLDEVCNWIKMSLQQYAQQDPRLKIASVYLVGGSSQLPKFVEKLRETLTVNRWTPSLDKRQSAYIQLVPDPEWCVARGAALAAQSLAEGRFIYPRRLITPYSIEVYALDSEKIPLDYKFGEKGRELLDRQVMVTGETGLPFETKIWLTPHISLPALRVEIFWGDEQIECYELTPVRGRFPNNEFPAGSHIETKLRVEVDGLVTISQTDIVFYTAEVTDFKRGIINLRSVVEAYAYYQAGADTHWAERRALLGIVTKG